MKGWLTVKAAAGRVDRDISTIYRWERRGLLTILAGHVQEQQLLVVDRQMRAARGRPRKQTS